MANSTDQPTQPQLSDGFLFGIGNPLLDVISDVTVPFIEEYGLKPNDAILSRDEHKDLIERLLRDCTYEFIAGGSTQNTMRAAVWLLQQPNVATYMGCVGQDKYNQLLHVEASRAGLILSYQVDPEHPTGTCAVLITDNNRSLVANLGAANHFTISHLEKNWSYLENAKILYTAGFFYTVCPEAVMSICEHSNKTDKYFCTNLSAPFICEHFGTRLMEAMPYVDYLFGNETEARCFAKTQLKLDTEDVRTIAKALSELPKTNSKHPRVVIITQGSDPTVMATNSEVRSFVVKKPLAIVDTNGAGDSFVGGFLAYLALNKSHEECIQAGAYVAYECIQQIGCKFPPKPTFDPQIFLP